MGGGNCVHCLRYYNVSVCVGEVVYRVWPVPSLKREGRVSSLQAFALCIAY